MMITIPIQCSMSSAEKAHFDTAFRVELYRLKSFSGAVCHKRNIMFFGHWVLYGYEKFIFDFFAFYFMFLVGLLCL